MFYFLLITLPGRALAQYPAGSVKGMNFSYLPVIEVAIKIISWFLGAMGILAGISLFSAIIFHLTSGGDDDRIALAKKAFVTFLVQFSISVLGLIIFHFAQKYFLTEGYI